jgi:hypothetical protein
MDIMKFEERAAEIKRRLRDPKYNTKALIKQLMRSLVQDPDGAPLLTEMNSRWSYLFHNDAEWVVGVCVVPLSSANPDASVTEERKKTICYFRRALGGGLRDCVRFRDRERGLRLLWRTRRITRSIAQPSIRQVIHESTSEATKLFERAWQWKEWRYESLIATAFEEFTANYSYCNSGLSWGSLVNLVNS